MEPNDNTPQPPSQTPPPYTPPAASPVAAAPARQKPGWLRRIVTGMLVFVLFVSLIINGYLILMVAAMSGGRLQQQVVQEGSEEQIVAIWNVSGTIMSEAAETFRQFHHTATTDDSIKAVVIRVDSPGGGVASSDEIYAMIADIAKSKPVVVSMGGLAASGGYYISAPTDTIFAEPGTATGSIGVIAQVPNLQGTAEKIGLDMQVIKSSHAEYWKDMLSPFREMQPRQRERLKTILDEMQGRFEAIVMDGRGDRLNTRELTFEVTLPDGQTAIRTETEPFNGMIYTAAEAKELGLVDEIGYESNAWNHAAELAGIQSPHVVRYGIQPSLMEMIFSQTSMSRIDADLQEIKQQIGTPRFMYLCTLP